MEATLTNLLLLFAAVAVGWLLGSLRRDSRPASAGEIEDDSSSYYKGLNYLLNEQADAAVMTVVNELPVRLQTLPTHLALGNLMRSKGEVEAAIRIHQNLLSRPSLPRSELHKVHLELARDYISAGLLDRAERLLRDLLEEASEYRSEALEHLRHIYQSEKEWEQAIAVAVQMLPRRGWLRKPADKSQPVALELALSHYHCELAERLLADGDLRAVRRELAKARRYDVNNLRAGLLAATLAMQQQQPQQALSELQALMKTQPLHAPQILPLFKKAFAELAGADQYVDALSRLSGEIDSSALAVELASAMAQRGDTEAARAYLQGVLRRRPTLRTLSCLLGLGEHSAQAEQALQKTVDEILASRAIYQCRQCGFSGRKLHWLCPSCEQWGTIAPIRGSQGD